MPGIGELIDEAQPYTLETTVSFPKNRQIL